MGDTGSNNWAYYWKRETVLVICRKLMFVAFGIHDCLYVVIRTRNGDVGGGGGGFFHLWPIRIPSTLQTPRLSDHWGLLASAFEWHASW